MLDNIVYWLGTAPTWQRLVACVIALLAGIFWVNFCNSLIVTAKDKIDNFNYWSEWKRRKPAISEAEFTVAY